MNRIVCLSIVLTAFLPVFANAQKTPTPSTTLETIGGLATHVLISSNLNIGLTMELRKAKNIDAKMVLTIAKQVQSQTLTNISQLRAFSSKTKFTKEDEQYLELILDGLNGVVDQTKAIEKAFQKGDSAFLDDYEKRRTDTASIIGKIVDKDR